MVFSRTWSLPHTAVWTASSAICTNRGYGCLRVRDERDECRHTHLCRAGSRAADSNSYPVPQEAQRPHESVEAVLARGVKRQHGCGEVPGNAAQVEQAAHCLGCVQCPMASWLMRIAGSHPALHDAPGRHPLGPARENLDLCRSWAAPRSSTRGGPKCRRPELPCLPSGMRLSRATKAVVCLLPEPLPVTIAYLPPTES